MEISQELLELRVPPFSVGNTEEGEIHRVPVNTELEEAC